MMYADSHGTPKRLLLVDENKAEGTFQLAYEYEVGVEKPIVNWEEAKNFANKKCESWGYRKVKFPKRGWRRCIDFVANDEIYCNKVKVTYKCRCLDKTKE